jgi:hypothetical protein
MGVTYPGDVPEGEDTPAQGQNPQTEGHLQITTVERQCCPSCNKWTDKQLHGGPSPGLSLPGAAPSVSGQGDGAEYYSTNHLGRWPMAVLSLYSL